MPQNGVGFPYFNCYKHQQGVVGISPPHHTAVLDFLNGDWAVPSKWLRTPDTNTRLCVQQPLLYRHNQTVGTLSYYTVHDKKYYRLVVTICITCLKPELTPRSKALLEKLIVAQLVKKFSAIFRI
jgi:hypothetical protein